MVEDDKKSGEGEAFHFISYVPYRGQLYELDGLQKGPIELGACTNDNWLAKAQEEIQKRISTHEGSEIRFVLMSLGQSLLDKYSKELEECTKKKEELEAAVGRGGEEATNAQALLASLNYQMNDLASNLNAEKSKRDGYKLENKRRKHKYIPFLLKFLKIVAEKGQLQPLVEKAKQDAN